MSLIAAAIAKAANELAATGHNITLTAHNGAAECTIHSDESLIRITERPNSVELAHIDADATQHETHNIRGYAPMLRTIYGWLGQA